MTLICGAVFFIGLFAWIAYTLTTGVLEQYKEKKQAQERQRRAIEHEAWLKTEVDPIV